MVFVQLCLPQPFSGQSETNAGEEEDVAADNSEGSDNGRSHEDQVTSNRTMPSGIPRLRNGGLDICFLNAAFVAFLKIDPVKIHEETAGEGSDTTLVKANRHDAHNTRCLYRLRLLGRIFKENVTPSIVNM